MPGLPFLWGNPSVSIVGWTGATSSQAEQPPFVVTTRLSEGVTLTSGYITDFSGNRYPLRIEGNLMIADAPDGGWLSGPALVEFDFVERGNSRADSFEIYIAAALNPEQISGRTLHHGGGFRKRDVEFRFRGRLSISVPVQFRQSGDIHITPAFPLHVRYSGSLQANRVIHISQPGIREPADLYLQILREDEELVLLGVL